MLVQEAGYLARTDVAAALQEAAGEGGDGVAVGVDEIGEYSGEFHLVGERGDVRVGVGEESGERVLVVGVDARDVGIRNDDVGEVSQGLDAVREADGEEREGEVGGGEEGFGGERGTAVPEFGLVVEWKGSLEDLSGPGEA